MRRPVGVNSKYVFLSQLSGYVKKLFLRFRSQSYFLEDR
jgi:hypothetical protein